LTDSGHTKRERSATGLGLELAPGWREVAPRRDAPGLLGEADGRLIHLGGDFSLLHRFGAVGPVDCPLAVDPRTSTAYRYVCESRLMRQDFSCLRAYDLKTGAERTLLDLRLSEWVLWLLEGIEGKAGKPGQLFGLLAADLPGEDRVVIQHRLFALRPGEARPRLRPVCRDAYRPLAFSRARRELVFAGAEGIYLLGLKGERRAALTAQEAPTGQGAAFDPSGAERLALGGDGIYLWDFGSGTCTRLTRQGRHPVWSADGSRIWYCESSADLFELDLQTGESRPLVRAQDNRYPEFWFARPVRQSGCGRFLAVSLSAKRLAGLAPRAEDARQRERVYRYCHETCLLDLERKELWRRDGRLGNLRWVSGRAQTAG